MNSGFSSKLQAPFDIPAAGQVDLECSLLAGEPGPFSNQLEVFVSDDGLRKIVLRVRGSVRGEVVPDAADHPSKNTSAR